MSAQGQEQKKHDNFYDIFEEETPYDNYAYKSSQEYLNAEQARRVRKTASEGHTPGFYFGTYAIAVVAALTVNLISSVPTSRYEIVTEPWEEEEYALLYGESSYNPGPVVQFGDTELTLPIRLADLKDAGWDYKVTVDGTHSVNAEAYPDQYFDVDIVKPDEGYYMTTYVTTYGQEESIPIEELTLGDLYIDESCRGISLANGVKIGMERESLEEALQSSCREYSRSHYWEDETFYSIDGDNYSIGITLNESTDSVTSITVNYYNYD